MNPYSAQDRLDAQMAASFAAVKTVFSWLPLRDIIEPPHQRFDAALARQIALHITIRSFNVPKRRVVELQDRSREAVNRALRTVDECLESPEFAEIYRLIQTRAREFFGQKMTDARNAA